MAGNSVDGVLFTIRSQYGHQWFECQFCRLKILDITNFNAILWILIIKKKVGMYFSYFSQAAGIVIW